MGGPGGRTFVAPARTSRRGVHRTTRVALSLGITVAALCSASGLASLFAARAAAAAGTSAPRYYVSLGDSYSVGYQPGLGSTPGYTVYVAHKTGLTLVNYGCGGATTTSILTTVGCPDPLPHTAGAVTYPSTTQAAAAEAFVAAHRRHVALITVSIGGNDVTGCASAANPITCVAGVLTDIKKNVTELARGLRAAVGQHVPIVGLTYPDVILGGYVFPKGPPSPARIALARISVVAFRLLINPALSKAYAAAGGQFVDVTEATGAYGSLQRTVDLAPYGVIPVPVARVCQLTWYCALGNIHATTEGYRLIGSLIVARLNRTPAA